MTKCKDKGKVKWWVGGQYMNPLSYLGCVNVYGQITIVIVIVIVIVIIVQLRSCDKLNKRELCHMTCNIFVNFCLDFWL